MYRDFESETVKSTCMRPWVLPVVSGSLVAAGWWVYIDGIMQQHAFGLDPQPDTSWYIPGLLATFAACLMACTPFDALAENSLVISSSRTSCGRCWLFFTFMMSFTAIVGSLLLYGALVEPMQDASVAASWAEPGPIAFLPRLVESPASSGDVWANIAASHTKHSAWPGIAAVMQTVLIFCGGIVWSMTRLRSPEL